MDDLVNQSQRYEFHELCFKRKNTQIFQDKKKKSLYYKIKDLGKVNSKISFDPGFISIDFNLKYQDIINQLVIDLKPWKKGPFKLGKLTVDSEWKSNLKWNRIKPVIKNLKNKKILDLGCNNGYFLFCLRAENPRLVIGLDPVANFFLQFFFLNQFFQAKNIKFFLFGYEELFFFPLAFDLVLCLGILYHHPSPLTILKMIYISLKKGGEVIVDCQGINSKQAFSFFPRERYFNKKNFFFLPSRLTVTNWLYRIGFKRINLFYADILSQAEQRATAFATKGGLVVGGSKGETIENIPYRFYIQAFK